MSYDRWRMTLVEALGRSKWVRRRGTSKRWILASRALPIPSSMTWGDILADDWEAYEYADDPKDIPDDSEQRFALMELE